MQSLRSNDSKLLESQKSFSKKRRFRIQDRKVTPAAPAKAPTIRYCVLVCIAMVVRIRLSLALSCAVVWKRQRRYYNFCVLL
jgi:hypothetical protein